MADFPAKSNAGPNLAMVYLAVIVGGLAIALDFASIDLALPALERQFGLSFDGVQWVINSYVLAFSVLMVAGGRTADSYGRKLVFLVGYGVFAVASLIGGAAWSGEVLIASRVLQGVGAAFLWPAMIGLACSAAGDARRATVLGVLFATCSVGNAAGPVVGGALTEWFSWRWVLWINLPMALLAMGITAFAIPRDRPSDGKPVHNDFAGMAVLTTGLVALMILAYQVPAWGWVDWRSLTLAILGFGLLAFFPLLEKRKSDPLIPPSMLKDPEIASLCFSVLAICQVFFVVLLYFTQFGMKFLGDDPAAAGARVIQFMISYGIVSYFASNISKKTGEKNLILAGLVLGALASFLLGWFGPGSAWVPFNVSLCLLGAAVGAVIPTLNSKAIGAVGNEKAGLVSGFLFMCQLSGAAVMLAINTAIFTAIANAHLQKTVQAQGFTLTPDQQTAAEAILSGGRSVFSLPKAGIHQIPDLAPIVTASYEQGLQWVMYLGAALLVLACLGVMNFVRK